MSQFTNMKNVNIYGPVNQLGYGVVVTNFVLELEKRGLEPALFPIMGRIDLPKHLKEQILPAFIRGKKSFDASAPCLKIWHQFDLASRIGSGRYFVLPIFELDRFDATEKHHLNSADHIIVSSDWAKKVLDNANLAKYNGVVPFGVDRQIFHEKVGKESETFTFLNCGKWEKRKGHDVLIKAFLAAFNRHDNVSLVMLPQNPFLSQQQTNRWTDLYLNNDLGRANKISILPRLATQEELAKLFASAHCGVFPVRAEGWNLEALELLSMGKSVITTDYSGHTQYCNDENSHLIKIDKFEWAKDYIFFDGKKGKWLAWPDSKVRELAGKMREVYETWKSGSLEPNLAGIETAKQLLGKRQPTSY